MKLEVKYPTLENFSKFGTVVGPQYKEKPDSKYHSYWHNLADISQLGDDGTVSYLEVERKDRKLFLDKMERHQEALEGFIPISGTGFFCLAPANPGGKMPNTERIEAFFIDGSSSFFLAPGVWHCMPFALTPQLKFVILLKKPTVENDVDIVDLSKDVEIVLVN